MRKRGDKAQMLKKKRCGGSLKLSPLWIITSHKNNQMEVLTVGPDGEGVSFLPVFSFEEEAQTFLCFLEGDEKTKGMGWSIRQTTPGELVSVLMAPCADVLEVALDPLPPLPFVARAMLPLVKIKRKLFVRHLMKERSGEVVAA
jgi:hypothetical protein